MKKIKIYFTAFFLCASLVVLNSCANHDINFDEFEKEFQFSKTLYLVDDSINNSIDLVISTTSQELLDSYTTDNVELVVRNLTSSSIAMNKSAFAETDSIEEPASGMYINFEIKNEVFEEDMTSFNIVVDVDLDEGFKNKWIQQSWTTASDYCDISRSCLMKKVCYQHITNTNGVWSSCLNEEIAIDNGDLKSIMEEGSDSIRVFVKFKDYDCLKLSFYD